MMGIRCIGKDVGIVGPNKFRHEEDGREPPMFAPVQY